MPLPPCLPCPTLPCLTPSASTATGVVGGRPVLLPRPGGAVRPRGHRVRPGRAGLHCVGKFAAALDAKMQVRTSIRQVRRLAFTARLSTPSSMAYCSPLWSQAHGVLRRRRGGHAPPVAARRAHPPGLARGAGGAQRGGWQGCCLWRGNGFAPHVSHGRVWDMQYLMACHTHCFMHVLPTLLAAWLPTLSHLLNTLPLYSVAA